MSTRSASVHRQGRIYRFVVNGTEYVAFIWQDRAAFSGRIEGQTHIPQYTGKTALAVRDTLQQRMAVSLDV